MFKFNDKKTKCKSWKEIIRLFSIIQAAADVFYVFVVDDVLSDGCCTLEIK